MNEASEKTSTGIPILNQIRTEFEGAPDRHRVGDLRIEVAGDLPHPTEAAGDPGREIDIVTEF